MEDPRAPQAGPIGYAPGVTRAVDFGVKFPDGLPRFRLESHDTLLRRRNVHHSARDHGCDLRTADALFGACVSPRPLQFRDVAGIDLLQRRILRTGRVASVDGPLVRMLGQEPWNNRHHGTSHHQSNDATHARFHLILHRYLLTAAARQLQTVPSAPGPAPSASSPSFPPDPFLVTARPADRSGGGRSSTAAAGLHGISRVQCRFVLYSRCRSRISTRDSHARGASR
jgi:hypothetical protein